MADPASVRTLRDFAAALDQLRGGRSYRALDRAASPQRLPGSTLSNLLQGRSMPTAETLTLFLDACGIAGPAQDPWLAAWERVGSERRHRPPGVVLVRESRLRLLGVQASIQVPDAVGELPPYVPRDFDSDLRTAVMAAAVRGGFVLLVGDSSVGKTRSMAEAVRSVLPDWWLLRPSDVTAILDFAEERRPNTVLWLDDLQRYLASPALPAAAVGDIIASGAVVTATLWTEDYNAGITRMRAPGAEQRADTRALLRLARVLDVPRELSAAERRRGELLVPVDERIRIALESQGAGFTQILASGPELIRRWQHATDPYGKAVITAALDAYRVGARAPLSRNLLEGAAPGYLTDAEQAEAPADWLDIGLDYATERLNGAAAALVPVTAGIRRIVGYTVAEFLYQQASRTEFVKSN